MGMSIALYRDKVKCHNPKRPEKNSWKPFSDMGLNGFIVNNVSFKYLPCLTEPKEISVRSNLISSVSLFSASYLPKPGDRCAAQDGHNSERRDCKYAGKNYNLPAEQHYSMLLSLITSLLFYFAIYLLERIDRDNARWAELCPHERFPQGNGSTAKDAAAASWYTGKLNDSQIFYK